MYNPYQNYPMNYSAQTNAYPTQMNINPMQINPQQSVGNHTMAIATEEEVLKYPVAPGNSIPFKIDGQPLIIEKSMGMSQFDSPKYKRYRLIEEDTEDISEDKPAYILKSVYENDRQSVSEDIKEIKNNIEEFTTQIYDDIDNLKKLINRNRVKKENGND